MSATQSLKKFSSIFEILKINPSDLNQKTIYEIKPNDFETLSDEKQRRELGKFFTILKSIQKPIRLVLIKEPIAVEIGSESKNLFIPRTYLMTNESLDNPLSSMGIDYSIVTSTPIPKAKDERLDHVLFEDGSLGRWYTMYKMPGTLPPAWIHQMLPYADLVSIVISPIENHIAIPTITREIGLLGAASQRNNIDALTKYQNATRVLTGLSRQETRLFTCSVCVLIKAPNLFELKNKDRSFRVSMRTLLASLEDTWTIQRQMNDRGIGKKMQIELGSASIFYPFVSADMIEVPNGIAIGVNLNTNAPVIYDYTKRINYNMLFLAASGAGKSVTMKTILSRLWEKYPTAHIFIVDPHGEYDQVGKYLEIPILRITEEKDLGFDPFMLLDSKDLAADMIGEITKATDLVRKEFRAKAQGCKTVQDLHDKVSDEAKKYLIDLIEGSAKDILAGDVKIGDKVIISLKGSPGDERTAMLLLFALGRLWKEIQKLPKSTPKILLVDEGWFLFRMSSAGKFLEYVARSGRKENVIFMFATQQPEDVLDDQYGRAISDNSDTKIILNNTEKASQKIKDAMELSDQEADMLPGLQRGQCLFLTKDHRLRVQITPSSEELKVFSTSPASLVSDKEPDSP